MIFNKKFAIDQLQYIISIIQIYLKEDNSFILILIKLSMIIYLAKTEGILFYNPVVDIQSIGKLLHFCHSWPDIIFAIYKLCRFVSCLYQIY